LSIRQPSYLSTFERRRLATFLQASLNSDASRSRHRYFFNGKFLDGAQVPLAIRRSERIWASKMKQEFQVAWSGSAN
jgi:hypothetical protein